MKGEMSIDDFGNIKKMEEKMNGGEDMPMYLGRDACFFQQPAVVNLEEVQGVQAGEEGGEGVPEEDNRHPNCPPHCQHATTCYKHRHMCVLPVNPANNKDLKVC